MSARSLAFAVLFAFPTLALAKAPSLDEKPKPPLTEAERRELPQITRTFFLKNSDEDHQTNEIATAIRNTLEPWTKIYLLPSENAIVVTGSQDQIDLSSRLIEDLDRPRKSYRVVFTLTTFENNKPIGTEHFSMVAVDGQRIVLKQGSKVPIATGSFDDKSDARQTQYTYLDIGINLEAKVTEFANGIRLQTKVEQSGLAPEQSSVGASDPVVRQSVLEGASILTPGKPLLLGSLDISGTTRRIDVAVALDPAS